MLAAGGQRLPAVRLAPAEAELHLTPRPAGAPALQYCSEVCGCSADPNAAATTASTTTGIAPAAEAGAADPLVKAFDGGITAGNAAGAEAAFNAGGKSSTAWQSADGCCATKPSRKAAPGWAEEWGAEEGL